MKKLRDFVINNPDVTTYGIALAIVGIVIWIVVALLQLSSIETLVVTKKSCLVTADIYRWTTVRKYNKSSVPRCAWDVDRDTYCANHDSTGRCTRWESEYDYSQRDWKYYKSISKLSYTDIQKPVVPIGDEWKVVFKYSYALEGTYRKGFKSVPVSYEDFVKATKGSSYKFRLFLGKLR